MTWASIFHGAGLAVVRCASLLVPWRQRAEWWREWRSELWHVRESCTPRNRMSWEGEREVAAFCVGAFDDALCLRRESTQAMVQVATTKGSPRQCLLLLAVVASVSGAVALLLPNVRAELRPLRYRLPSDVRLIHDAQADNVSVPTMSVEQYRTWRARKQHLFSGFAFYRVAQETVAGERGAATVAHASANLFELLRMAVRFAAPDDGARGGMPKVILSDEVWRREFGHDSRVAGSVVRMGSRKAVVYGVAPAGAWSLPGKVDVWVLESDAEMSQDGLGYVVARQGSVEKHPGSWSMSAPRPDGTVDDFLCALPTDGMYEPWGLFLFAVFMACLALPATTPLALGEYLLSSRKISWRTRLRRWSFLGGKITLLLPVVYFVSLDVAYMRASVDAVSAQYVQIVCAFCICLFGLRWAMRDQRQRCPVCLGKLTHPARVGQPSRNFLAWNGTELMCVGGHGLLHVPELATSWFSTQRWMYLDASWEVLFAEPCLVSTGYL